MDTGRSYNILARKQDLRQKSYKSNMFPTFLTTLFIFTALSPLIPAVTVTTKYGKLKGLVTSYTNASGPFKSVSKFLGVPFAAPPVGELRLKAPQPPSQWKPNVRPAEKHGNICFQNPVFGAYYKPYVQNFSFSEDCLYLDIYSPNVSSRLPVLFYIHGGGFQADTSIRYPSDVLALQGVVVVVIQYRLGAFGFLTTGDSVAPGNLGMLDQVEALKWVKENIKDFGGNPNQVTIFGESAGGISVGLHLISPLSKGLFQQAIAESGVDLCFVGMQPVSYGLRYARELAQKLGCTVNLNDHYEMVACIRTKQGTDIQKAADAMAANFRFLDHMQWAPVVDKKFLLDTPRNLRKRGDFRKVPLIISFNSHEGSHVLGALASTTLGLNASLDNGTSQAFFKSFLTKFAHARDSR